MTAENFDPKADSGKFKCATCGSNPHLDGHKPDCPWNCARPFPNTHLCPFCQVDTRHGQHSINCPSHPEMKAWAARTNVNPLQHDGSGIKNKIITAKELDKMLLARINRSSDIETLLIKMSKGQLPLPNEQDCLVMALRLGTPKKDWSDVIKNHKFGESDETN